MRGKVRTTETVLRIFLVSIFIISSLIPTPAAAQALADKLRAWWQERSHNVDLQPLTLLPEQEAVYYQPPFDENKLLRFSPDPDGPDPDRPPKREKKLIEFTLDASPSVVARDGLVTITATIRNNSSEELLDLTYTDQLEEGLEWVADSVNTATYDSGTRTVTTSIEKVGVGEEVTITYVLYATPKDSGQSPNGRLWVHTAELQSQDHKLKLKTWVHLWVGYSVIGTDKDIGVVNPKGGWIDMAAASIYLERGAVGREAAVMSAPVRVAGKGPTMQFMLEIFETAGIARGPEGNPKEQKANVGSAITEHLDVPAFLKVKFDQIADLNSIPAGKEPFVATYDEEHQVWVKIPILEVDYEDNSVMVKTVHFSVWGAGLGDSMPQNGANVLLFNQPYTSLFTGSARYSVPVWTPPGRAGMAPSLALSYSSATVDGVLGDVQAPWVGVGWNIDGIEIVRKITTDGDGYGYENEFVLTLNGALHDLIQDETDPTRFHTKRGSFLYIERHNVALGNDEDVENDTGEWWEVVAPDGTRYRLGWNTDSEQLALMYGYECTTGSPCNTPEGAYASLGYAGIAEDLVVLRWRVDRITDTHDNFIDYTYFEEHPDTASQLPNFDRASFVASIKYTGHLDSQGEIDVIPGYEVKFSRGNRSGVGDGQPVDFGVWDNYDEKYLSKIEIFCNVCDIVDDPVPPVRTYTFSYSAPSVPNTQGTLVLDSIMIDGGGFDETIDSTNVDIPDTEAAKLRFSYENKDNREVTGGDDPWTYPRLIKIDNGYEGTLTYTYENDGRGTDSWYNWRVSKVVVYSDDGTSGTAAVQGYTYDTPLYGGEGSNPALWELFGYTNTTETSYEFDETTKILDIKHHFGSEGLDVGRELSTEWKNPSNSDVLRKVVNTYVTDNSQAPFEGWNYRYLAQVENYMKVGSGLSLINKFAFQRDSATGNLILRATYLGSTLYRKQYFEYVTNTNPDVYILDRVSRQVMVDSSNNVFADTRYQYDSGGTLSKGDLILVQSLIDATQTVDVRYLYDPNHPYGNLTETRVYTSYGTVGTTPSGSYQSTSMTYESTFYTYPTTITNALIQSSTMYYFYSLGLPYQVKDPNSFTTTTKYDGLGRVTEAKVPGINQAVVKYTYPSPDEDGLVSAPYSIHMQILDTHPTTEKYRSGWGIYDGLGRIIQNQVCVASLNAVCPSDGSATLLITDTSFNAQGLVDKQSVPRSETGTGGTYYSPAWGSLDKITTIYDLLGRTTQVTSPGNLITQLTYSGLSTTVTDANGNKVRRDTDGLGRLVKVREYTNGSTLYATTRYAYDVADRLKKVTDAQSNVTKMQYDFLGRKTGMDDPDMGIWAYVYDPPGNLIEQTDGVGQILGFSYNALNRLTQKTDESAEVTLATYTYGTTLGEIGFRTSMTDLSGSTTWEYSNEGRTVTEKRTIDSLAEKEFTADTDWLGRVEKITYPGNEEITYTYDSLGRPDSFSSDGITGSPTLADLAYNTLGQITTVTLGNGAVITNDYDTENSTFRLENRSVDDGTNLLDFDYYYDSVGNITQINDNKLGEIITYEYDDLDRLISAEAITGTEYEYRRQYEYDKVGNILQVNKWDTTDIIHRDDFESGDLTGWSSSVTDSGDLSVTNSTWIIGSYSMAAAIDDTTAIYVVDDKPNDEVRYRARFYFDPNTITMSEGEIFQLFGVYDSATLIAKVEMRGSGGAGIFQVRVGILDETSGLTDGSWHLISDAWTSVEIDWAAATSPGADDGYLTLWVDGQFEETLATVDNDTHGSTDVRLGAVDGLDSGTSGTLYFDAFESRRYTYIGMLPEENPISMAEDMRVMAFGTRVRYSKGANSEISYRPEPVTKDWNQPVYRPLSITLNDSLVSYWKLDETSGTRVDSHDNNDLTDNNTVTQATGKLSNAAQFTNANNEFLSIADNSDVSTGDIDWTFSIWVYLDNKTTYQTFVAKDEATKREYAIYYDVATDRFRWTVLGTSDNIIGDVKADNLGSPSTGTWYLIIVWHSATDNEVGIQVNNGTADTSSTTGAAQDDTAAFELGRNYATNYLDGRVDELGFWKRLLATSERSSLYNNGNGLSYPFAEPTPTPMPTATPTPTNTPTPTDTPTPTPTVDPSALDNNLSAYWSLDETSGTRVDSHDNNDLTDSNTVGYGAGKKGNASYFISSNSEALVISDNADLSTGDIDWTFSIWVYLDNKTTTQTFVGKDGAGKREYVIYYDVGTDRFRWVVFGTSDNIIGDVKADNLGSPSTGTWYLIILWHSATNNEVGIQVNNGTADTSSTTGAAQDDTAPFELGRSWATNYLDGRIDEFGFWKRILTADERSTLYNNGEGLSYPFDATPTSTPTPTHTHTPTNTPTPVVGAEWHFIEGTGTTAADSSVNDNTITLVNGTDWTDGVGTSGSAITFDGDNDYAYASASASLSPSNGFTIAAWIYPTEIGTDRQTVFNKGDGSHDYSLWTNDEGILEFHMEDLTPNKVIGPVPPLNTWTYVVGVYDKDNGQIKLYVNGVLVASRNVTGTLTYNAYKLAFGHDGTGDPHYWKGHIDEVTLYGRVLNSTEITTRYGNNPTPTPTISPTPTSTPTPTISPTPLSEGDERWGTGNDGSLTVDSGNTFNIHTDGFAACDDGGDAVAYSISTLTAGYAVLSQTPDVDCLSAGDEVLLINLQGTQTKYLNVGRFEFLRVGSVDVGNSKVTFLEAKIGFYGENINDDSNIGTGTDQQRVMLIRVPNYTTVDVDGTLTGGAFDGYKYGVIAFRVSGTLSGAGTIDGDELGFNGGAGGVLGVSDDFGKQGESYPGPGVYSTSNNGGGGGAGFGNSNNRGRGGGGGGYGNEGEDSTIIEGGDGHGSLYLSKMLFGSGGGGGGTKWDEPNPQNGGAGADGGGIIFVAASTVNFTGTVNANGGDGTYGVGYGGGGAGAGGSVRVEVDTLTDVTINAEGGIGDGYFEDSAGGDGGDGRIAIYHVNTPSSYTTDPLAYTDSIYGSPQPTPTPTPIDFTLPGPYGDGADGDVTISSGTTKNLHTDNLIGFRYCGDGGDGVAYSVVALTASTAQLDLSPAPGCLNPGDEVILISMRGTSSNNSNVGNYEFLRVGGLSDDTVLFTSAKENYYGENAGDDTNIGISTGQQRVILMRVPNYNNLTVTGTLTGNAWDDDLYGLLVFRVYGTLSGAGTIYLDGLGFRGGDGGTPYEPFHGAQGESYTGAGASGFWWANGGAGGAGTGYSNNRGLGAGGGGYGTDGEDGYIGVGGATYRDIQMETLFLGSGGGGGGGKGSAPRYGTAGGVGGGSLYIMADTISFTGTITLDGDDSMLPQAAGGEGGAGAGGGLRIDGDDIDLTSANISLDGGTAPETYFADGQGGDGGDGRSAIYYETSYSFPGGFTPGYLAYAGTADAIFSDDFESGDLTEWSTSSITDSGDLVVSTSADYWGDYGLLATIDDTNSIYAQHDGTTANDSLSDESRYRARFYFDPNGVTIGSSDELDILVGRDGAVDVFRVEVQDNSGTYRVRVSVRLDTGTPPTWTDGTWYDITDGWNAIEIDWQAASVSGANDGHLTLWLEGVMKETLSGVDNDTYALVSVRLGAMEVDNGTSGSVYFDDFESRRMSYIDVLPDPGIPDPEPTAQPSWLESDYSYTGSAPHAVSSVEREQTDQSTITDTYVYDFNGNMTCRDEAGQVWKHDYNAENRISVVYKMDGADCTTQGSATETWSFTYDGNGVRVKEEYKIGTTEQYTKYYFAGGGYEIEVDHDPSPDTTTTKKYYAIAGKKVAMEKVFGETNTLYYFANDHLSSSSIVMNSSGGLLHHNRYMPFGEVREITGDDDPITETDFGFTGQRNISDIGLMDYNARFYSPTLGRFIQPDSIIPSLTNPQSLNRFSYVLNNPMKYTDPTGYSCYDPEMDVVIPNCYDDDEGDSSDFSFSVNDELTDEQLQEIADRGGLTTINDPEFDAIGGLEMIELYKNYRDTCGWWNDECSSPFSLVDFIAMTILAENTGLGIDGNDDYYDLVEEALGNLFLYEGSNNAAGVMDPFTAIFNAISTMGSMRKRYNNMIAGIPIAEPDLPDKWEYFLDIANNIIPTQLAINDFDIGSNVVIGWANQSLYGLAVNGVSIMDAAEGNEDFQVFDRFFAGKTLKSKLAAVVFLLKRQRDHWAHGIGQP